MSDRAGPAAPGVAEQLAHRRAAAEARLARVGRVVAVTSGKGGVGKTTLAANLAAALAASGRRVGALDADLHGASLARMLGARGQRPAVADGGVRPAVGVAEIRVMAVDLLRDEPDAPLAWDHPGGLAADSYAWRGLMEAGALRDLLADTSWGDLDVLVLDLPPGADRYETVARIVPRIDAVVEVTIPSSASIDVVRRAIRAARRAGAPEIGLVVNMAGLACGACGHETPLFGDPAEAERMADEAGATRLGRVPFDPRLAAAGDAGRPLVLTNPEAPASRALDAIARRLSPDARGPENGVAAGAPAAAHAPGPGARAREGGGA